MNGKLIRYAVALVLVAIAFCIRSALSPIVGDQIPFLLFLPAIMVAVWFARLGPALVALVLSLLLGDFFFLPPIHNLGLRGAAAFVNAVVFLFSSLLAIGLIEILHRTRERLGMSETHQLALQAEISQRQAAEQALRANEEKFRALFHSTKDAIFIHEPGGPLLDVNREASERLGYTRQEFMNMQPQDIDTPEFATLVPQRLEQLLQQGHILFASAHKSRDGSIIPVEINCSLFEIAGKKLVVSACRDLTERRRAEEALRENRARLDWVLQATGVGLWLSELPLGRLNWDDQTKSLFFVSPETEPDSDLFWSRLHPDDRQSIQLAVEAAIRDRALYNVEHRVVNPATGDVRWIRSIGRVAYSPDGCPVRFDGINYDITARKQAEQALQDAHEKLITVLESIGDAFFSTDRDCRLTYMNRESERLLRRSREQLLGRSLWDVLPEAKGSRFQREYERAIAENKTVHFEEPYPASKQWIEVHAYPSKIGVSVYFNDITERKRTEQELRHFQNQLKQYAETLEARVAERTHALQSSLNSLEDILYHVAHDLRAPVRAMHSFTELLLEHPGLEHDPLAEDYGRRIQHAAVNMDALITDLLAYGKLGHQQLSLKEIDLFAFLQQLLAAHAPKLQSKNAEVDLIKPMPCVWADEDILECVLAQLLSNAVKFVAPGVRPRVRIWAEIQGDTVLLNIQDNGIGISSKYHQQIFQTFQRLSSFKGYPGTGIGLAIAKKGMERLGANIRLASAPGQGSRFWIELRPVELNSPNKA